MADTVCCSDMALGNRVGRASGARLLSGRSLALFGCIRNPCSCLREAAWGEVLANAQLTRSYLQCFTLLLSLHHLWSHVELSRVQDGCLRSCREQFLSLFLRKVHFSMSVQQREGPEHLELWLGKQGYRQETESNSEAQETSVKGCLTEVWAGLREPVGDNDALEITAESHFHPKC